MRYENIKKPCRQRDHIVTNLLDYNNVWFCKKCKNILIGNGKSTLPANYEYYVKFCKERNMKIYDEDEIEKFINKNS